MEYLKLETSGRDSVRLEGILLMWKAQIEKRSNSLFTIISGEQDVINSVLGFNDELYHHTINTHINLADVDTLYVSQTLIGKFAEQCELSDDFYDAMENHVFETYGNGNLKSGAYIEKTYNSIMLNHFKNAFADNVLRKIDVPTYAQSRSYNKVMEQLNAMIGMENVKNELNDLSELLKFNTKMRGIANIEKPNLHMVFTGSSGTGKTTTARLVAEILHQLGYIKQNKLRNCKKINFTLLAKNAILIKGDENGYYNKKSNYKDASFIE